MAHVYALPPIPGVKDLLTLLAFLGDKDAYAARLDDMLALEEGLNALVEKVGKAEDIDQMHAAAKVVKEQADKEVALARQHLAEQKQALEREQALLQKNRDDLAGYEQGLHEREQALLEHQAALASDRDAMEANLASRQESLIAAQAQARQKMEEAQGVLAAYTAKLDQIKTVAGL